ncbi:MAG: SPOR domain-containing protein [Deltaproteobacteria bacterium]|nr:SPOR domain-containing protein [Deltaproteobacteria bacterium]
MAEYPERDEHDESFFCRFTFGQFFAILLLEVFTLFFVFYLGARYGREFLGMPDVQPLAAAPTSEPQVTTTTDPEVTAMAHELIEKADTPELKERIATMLQKEQSQKVNLVPQEIPPAEEEIPNSEATIGEVAAIPEGAVRVKSAEHARYSVQVGSYPDLTQANASIDQWKGKGYPAYLMIADIPDRGRWYRVRIGGFEARPDAEAYLRQVVDREGIDALVVLNEQ